MKKIAYISVEVQAQIIREYKQKNPDGNYTYLLKEIADKHQISLSSVHNLARMAQCQNRPRGGRTRRIPDARTMKILRDASQPGMTMERVGQLNPYIRIVRGRRIEVPLTKQRVSQIVNTWKEKLGDNGIHGKGFVPGDKIEWAEQKYVVLSYDSSHRGAAIDISDTRDIDPFYKVIDPFCWAYKGSRTKFIEPAPEGSTEEQVWKQYVGCDRATHARRASRTSDKRRNSAAQGRRSVST